MQTAPLTVAQAGEIEQLIGSRDISLCTSIEECPVIITDHTLEADNSDDTLTSLKFTFRFPGKRPRLSLDEMGGLMPGRTHIFTQEFTAEFT
ncbi:MAG TPA: hypothetical protein DD424_03965 [Porphyromonadaceae bacterium]|nr:hypothetical protein [Porphyromonadaceae bacterium]